MKKDLFGEIAEKVFTIWIVTSQAKAAVIACFSFSASNFDHWAKAHPSHKSVIIKIATIQIHKMKPATTNPVTNFLFKIRALGSLGFLLIKSSSAGPAHIEIAGKISVQRFIQRIKIAVKTFGIKRIIEEIIVTSSQIY